MDKKQRRKLTCARYYQKHKKACNKRCMEHYKKNKEKYRENLRKWRIKNREHFNEQAKSYRLKWKKNPIYKYKEKIAKWNKNSYIRNLDNYTKYRKVWAKSPKGRALQKKNKALRRALEINAVGEFDKDEWLSICNSSPLCKMCGRFIGCDNLTLDHIIPLKRGGCNYVWNIQAICKSCNIKKSDNLPSILYITPEGQAVPQLL